MRVHFELPFTAKRAVAIKRLEIRCATRRAYSAERRSRTILEYPRHGEFRSRSSPIRMEFLYSDPGGLIRAIYSKVVDRRREILSGPGSIAI